MDAIKLLKDDHKKVKGLFREYEAAGDRAYQTKRRIAEQAFLELEVHSKIEEEIFYPAVREKAGKEGKELVAEGVEEHHVVDVLIEELKGLEPEDEQYDAKFTVLTENVEHHIEEEEKEMMPEAKEALGDHLADLGEQMLRRKEELLAQMGARA
jgi:hemerythrin-like domain-containing protein